MAIEDVEKAGRRLVGKMLEDLRKEKPAQPKTVFAAVLVSLPLGGATERRCLAAEVDDGDGEMQSYIEELARDAQPFLQIGERVIVERFRHVFVHGDV